MSDDKCEMHSRLALAGSVAVNIFLVAFLLGRITMQAPHPMPPPPFEGARGGPMMMVPPSPMPFGMQQPDNKPKADRPNEGQQHPFLGASALFTPEEVKQGFASMKTIFDKIGEHRMAFAKQLKDGPVSKEDVLKHFGEIDQLMNDVRKGMQEKAASKISSMSADERQRLAENLSQFEQPR